MTHHRTNDWPPCPAGLQEPDRSRDSFTTGRTHVTDTTRNAEVPQINPGVCGLGHGTGLGIDRTRRTILHVARRTVSAQHLRDLARLRRVRDRIDRDYAQPLDVEALARGAHMSAGHLSREFKLAYGESPYSYLMTRRIERAMALLRRGDLSVTEVCFAVGCSSLGTFSTRFTELTGMPPSTYRTQAARATAGMPPCVAKQVTRPVRNREAPVNEPQLT
jgi:AraC-like DNA-binding protein